jgi:hypothetical protein
MKQNKIKEEIKLLCLIKIMMIIYKRLYHNIQIQNIHHNKTNKDYSIRNIAYLQFL